jgi:hypothetical protein
VCWPVEVNVSRLLLLENELLAMNSLKNKHYLGIWYRHIAEPQVFLDWKTVLARFPPTKNHGNTKLGLIILQPDKEILIE